MANAKIYYQEDCNLSLLEGKTNCSDWLWQPGTCTRIKRKRFRM